MILNGSICFLHASIFASKAWTVDGAAFGLSRSEKRRNASLLAAACTADKDGRGASAEQSSHQHLKMGKEPY